MSGRSRCRTPVESGRTGGQSAPANGAGAPPPRSLKYWAFISYSHRDQRWARWLHRTLESYRVPRRLVGKPSRDGGVPGRLFPIFRDREELPVSADLGANIKTALERSRYLVVVCSPSAAESIWVDEEVRLFKRAGGESRVLALIVAGEPNASDKSGARQAECFPQALRFRLAPDGTSSAERTEPIAADVRAGKDGAANARLKVLAGLLGVDYDELKRRDASRRFRRRVLAVTAGLALTGAIAAGWQWQARRGRIERYLAQGRQELDAGNSLRALAWLAEAWQLGEHGEEVRGLVAQAGRALVPQQALIDSHEDWVSSAAFSPDGRRLLTASWDRTATIWALDGERPRAVARFGGHRWKLASAAFSADGRRVVTAGWDAVAKVWNADGTPIVGLEGHRGRVNTAAFSPDDQFIVTASDDGTARLWRPDGTPVRSLDGHDDFVKSAAFDADGTRIVTASLDGGVRVWAARTGALLLVMESRGLAATGAAFSPDGQRIVAGYVNGAAKLWDAATGASIATFTGHRRRLNAAAFSPDGTRIVTAGDDGAALVWDARTLEVLASIEPERSREAKDGSRGKVLSAAFSPDGTRVVTASDDNSVRIWSAVPPSRSIEEIVAFERDHGPWLVAPDRLLPRR